MAYHDIYMTDDIYRPSDADLNPIEQSSSELSISIAGYQYDWYFSAFCRWWEDQADTESLIYWNTYLMAKSPFTSATPSLRFVIQVLVSGSVVYEDTKTASNYYNDQINIHSRELPTSSSKMITRTYEGSTFGNVYNWTKSGNISLSAINVVGMPYMIRCKIQRLVNNAWTDVSRGSTPWKTLASYAPLYQSITPPSHFYANGINRFTAPIGTDYIFNYYGLRLSRNGYAYTPVNKIVRSINPPYAVSGISTQYLYFCPGHTLPADASNRYSTYAFTVELSVIDPGDSDFEIVVAKRKVSGDVEYKDVDDLSMYGTPSWTLTDPTGMYEEYGVLLRNIASAIILTMSCTSSYGALIDYRYYNFGEGGSSSVLEVRSESQSVSVQLTIPTHGESTDVGARISSSSGFNIMLNEEITIPIVSYSVPSLPVASIHRCDSDGTANDNGDHCRIDWAVAITSINNQNSKKLTIRHPEGTTEFDPLDSYTQSGSLIVAASTESTYGIDFTVSDDLNTITKSLRLSTAQAVLDLLYGGGGVAFGKVANVQDAVEISELWKLICYKLMLNGIDMNKWVKQLESRVGALEQFAGNTGSTTQFQVSFFNGSELLARNWIRSGQDATEPSQVPTKDATQKKTYSFAGWSKSSAASTVDSDALTNITAHRDLYAVFREDIRYYTVRFISDGEVIKTGDNLQYQYSLARPNTPAKTGYVFVGWCPSGRIINGDTDAIAQFWDNSEITDDWATIMEAVSNGTATQFYKPGQYKVLDCGVNGSITMRIKGFKLDKIANSEKRVQLSWESVDLLTQTKRINPAYQAGTEGTGALGGWSKSELRQWLNGEFYNSIDSVVRNQIKSVGKSTTSRDVNGNSVRNEITIDKVFIPSAEEIIGHYQYLQYNASNVFEVDGMDFMYTDSAYTAKKAYGTTTNIEYWLRTVSRIRHDSFLFYRSLSEINTDTANKSKGICIGFCT